MTEEIKDEGTFFSYVVIGCVLLYLWWKYKQWQQERREEEAYRAERARAEKMKLEPRVWYESYPRLHVMNVLPMIHRKLEPKPIGTRTHKHVQNVCSPACAACTRERIEVKLRLNTYKCPQGRTHAPPSLTLSFLFFCFFSQDVAKHGTL